jgi:hypothetical protein
MSAKNDVRPNEQTSSRGTRLPDSVRIGRKSLHKDLEIEMEDPRCKSMFSRDAKVMEDPRYQNLRNW